MYITPCNVECILTRLRPFQYASQLVFRQVALNHGERLYVDHGAMLSKKRMKMRRGVIITVHYESHAVDDCDRWLMELIWPVSRFILIPGPFTLASREPPRQHVTNPAPAATGPPAAP